MRSIWNMAAGMLLSTVKLLVFYSWPLLVLLQFLLLAMLRRRQ